jgi:predicted site-specific integrase-resolvase
VNLKEWARQQGVHPVTAYRWFREGKLPVPARRAGRLILVDPAPASVSAEGLAVGRVVTEVGSALNGKRRKFLALLRDDSVTAIVVEHRDRFARFGAEYVEAALSAQGRKLLVVDPAEVDDDLVRDVTEILTSLCARLYGRRAAANRARRAIDAVTGDAP